MTTVFYFSPKNITGFYGTQGSRQGWPDTFDRVALFESGKTFSVLTLIPPDEAPIRQIKWFSVCSGEDSSASFNLEDM